MKAEHGPAPIVRADVVVIGGGSTGTSVAFQLARRFRDESGRRRVLLVERDTA